MILGCLCLRARHSSIALEGAKEDEGLDEQELGGVVGPIEKLLRDFSLFSVTVKMHSTHVYTVAIAINVCVQANLSSFPQPSGFRLEQP